LDARRGPTGAPRRLLEQLDTAKHGKRLRQITHGLVEAGNYRQKFTAIDL